MGNEVIIENDRDPLNEETPEDRMRRMLNCLRIKDGKQFQASQKRYGAGKNDALAEPTNLMLQHGAPMISCAGAMDRETTMAWLLARVDENYAITLTDVSINGFKVDGAWLKSFQLYRIGPVEYYQQCEQKH